MEKKMLLSVGVLLYRSEQYRCDFFESLEKEIAQVDGVVEVFIRDHAEEDAQWVCEHYPKYLCEQGENVGFAKGHNVMVQKSKGKYYACLNPDMVLEEGYLRLLVERMEEAEQLGSVQGRIMRNDEVIDSLGLKLRFYGKAVNIGEGRGWKGRFRQKLWGVTGAAAIYRRAAFVEVGGFDERMFMYQEDVDLAYRLQKAGWKSECVYDAVVYHDRTVRVQSRRKRSLKERKWSYHHHLLFLQNHWGDFPVWQKVVILWYEWMKLVYIFLFEKEVFGEFRRWRKL